MLTVHIVIYWEGRERGKEREGYAGRRERRMDNIRKG